MRKLMLMLWKNFTIEKRHPCRLCCEVSLPLIINILILLFRGQISIEPHDDKHFAQFDPTNLKSETDKSLLTYSPYNKILDDVINRTASQLKKEVLRFNSSKAMGAYFSDEANLKGTWAAVQFDDYLYGDGPIPKNLDVRLRFPDSSGDMDSTWQTQSNYPKQLTAGPRESDAEEGGMPFYHNTGFLALQQVLCINIINYYKEFSPPNITMQRFPAPAWTVDGFMQIIFEPFLILLILCYIVIFMFSIKTITVEKETQIMETLKIYGVPQWQQWLAHFIRTFILLYALLLISIIMFCFPLVSNVAVIEANKVLMLIFFFLYTCATITYSFFISSLCPSSGFSGLIGVVTWITPMLIFGQLGENFTLNVAFCLLSNVAVMHGFHVISNFQNQKSKAGWNNLWTKPSPHYKVTMGHVLLFLFLDTIIYLGLAMYINAVFPGQYGVPEVWYFPCSPSFWRRGSKVEDEGDTNKVPREEAGNHEREPTNLKVGVSISHLRKVFGKKVAVEDLSLNMYEGQITALLGHNGAGKTTTMNMLIGMIPATKGKIIVNGVDVSRNPKALRNILGFCPQHNILFGELTVKEHIYLFAKLKGVESSRVKKDTVSFLQQMKFEHKANTKAANLSGGMKRKLSIGIAMCGGSKIVLFDEPTAGMDPIARRDLWELLLAQRKDRTILLSTHYMDEADLLGDRIAIVAEGRLKCSGTGFFLKKKFGSGYHLIIAKLPGCNSNQVQRFIGQYLPGTKIASDVGSELRFILRSQDSGSFEILFRNLEQNRENLRVGSFGMSLPTIEEVFLKMGATEDFEVHDDIQESNVVLLTGFSLCLNKFCAMIMKKALIYWRSWLFILCHILLGILPIIFLIHLGNKFQLDDLPALKISLQPFSSPVTVFSYDERNVFKDPYVNVLNAHNGRIEETTNVSETLIEKTKNDFYDVRLHYIAGASFSDDGRINGWFNGDPYHAAPVSLDLIIKAVIKQHLQSDYSITVWNYPLPMQAEKILLLALMGSNYMGLLMLMVVTQSVIIAMFLLIIIKERANNAKHQQFVSGIGAFIYWITHLLFDMTIFTLISSCIAIVFLTSTDDIHGEDFVRYIFLNFLVFGWFAITLGYVFSLMISSPSSGYVYYTIYNLIVLITLILAPILETTKKEIAAQVVHYVSRLIPSYTLYNATSILLEARRSKVGCDQQVDRCVSLGNDHAMCQKMICEQDSNCCGSLSYTSGQFNMSAVLYSSLILGCICLILVILIDSKILTRICSMICVRKSKIKVAEEDDDVVEEKRRVRSMKSKDIEEHKVVVKDLTKYFRKFLAVNNLCLAIKGSECFGLLGINGAGKSTTFKMLTGDIVMSSGDIYIGGFSIRSKISKIHKIIGYCPQFDALFENLTGKENLIIYGLIRGVPYRETKKLAVQLSKEFDFHRHLDKKVRYYSGGNKRKLNTALAFQGDTDVIFLDEPTAGMDPATRRYFWNVLCKVRDKGKCIVLTSHSMEECEALCTKIAIMVAGNLKCLGAIQHLKGKFAKGFTLTFMVTRETDQAELDPKEKQAIERFIGNYFPTAKLEEQYQDMFTYQIAGDDSMSWSRIFGIIEANKHKLHIVDYSVTQSSLERVFLSFS